MRRIIVLFILSNLLGIINAQQIYFNKRYDFNQSNADWSSSLKSTGQGFLIKASTRDTIGSTPYLSIRVVLTYLNDSGNVQSTKILRKPKHNLYDADADALQKTQDGGYIVGSSIDDSTGNVDVLLFKYNNVGDTLWTKQFGDTSYQSCWAVKQTRDNGYILTGQTDNQSYNDDILLIKTDSSGNLQWQSHYGGSGYDLGLSIDTCYDGGFIICGYTESYGINPAVNFGNIYVIKTDSLGNLKWYRAIGGQYADNAWSCLQSIDGNYIIAGGITYYDPLPGGGDDEGKPYIIKLDTSGNTIWAKDYGPIALGNSIYSIKELFDGSFISVGQLYDSSANFRLRGFILKTDSQGDSIWYRTYANITGQYSDNMLVDIVPTSDGGFAACGTVFPSLPDTGTQDVWVLKVDSNGCEIMNCTLNSIGEIISKNQDEINVFPNPSQNIFHFNLSDEGDEIKNIKINDILDEEVLFSTKNEIDLTNFSNGIYFYEVITMSHRNFQGKLIKQ